MFTLRKQVERGVLVKRIIQDELFIEAIETTRQNYIDELVRLPLNKEAEIMNQKRKIVALDDVVQALTGIESAGKFAEANMKK